MSIASNVTQPHDGGPAPWSIRVTAILLWVGSAFPVLGLILMIVRARLDSGFAVALFSCFGLVIACVAAAFALGAWSLPRTGNLAVLRILAAICLLIAIPGVTNGVWKVAKDGGSATALAVLFGLLVYGLALLLLPLAGGGREWATKRHAFVMARNQLRQHQRT